MGKRGPARTPTAQLEARGSWLVRDRIAAERALPAPTDDALQPPSFLSSAAKAVWTRTVRRLAPLRVLRETDIDELAAYCDAVARWESCVRWIARHGECDRATGKMHDRTRVAFKLREQISRLAARFGLTPADRSAVPSSPQAPAETGSGAKYLRIPRTASGGGA